jgi:exopolysaccharide biosynthesis polyprenyl glycosylphosphotransferase
MLKAYRYQFNIVCALADLGALVAAFLAAYALRREVLPLLSATLARRPVFPIGDYLPVFLLSSLVILGSVYALKGYALSPSFPLSSAFFLNTRAMVTAFLVTLALAYLLKLTFLSRIFLVSFLFLFVILSTTLRYTAALWFRRAAQRGRYTKRVLLVGAGAQARLLGRRILERPELGVQVRGFLSAPGVDTEEDVAQMTRLGLRDMGQVAGLPDLLEAEVVDGVVFCVTAASLGSFEDLFLMCEDQGVDTLMAANLFPHLVAQVHLERLEELPLLRFTTVPHNYVALFLKRVIDLFSSALGLLVLSPLLLAVAALIKSTSRGPVLFSQERVGLHGRRFFCHKFRTMVHNAEELKADLSHLNEADGPVFKIRRDPRITPVGRLLRKLSLDELPQLWNVLVGEMSLVGPRPPIPSEVDRYARWQRRRLSMRPGITCLWQISGRSELDFDTWMRLDLQYIDHWSLTLDFVILAKTLPAVLSTRGAA